MARIFSKALIQTFQPYTNVDLSHYEEDRLRSTQITIDLTNYRVQIDLMSIENNETETIGFQVPGETARKLHYELRQLFIQASPVFANIGYGEGVHEFLGGLLPESPSSRYRFIIL